MIYTKVCSDQTIRGCHFSLYFGVHIHMMSSSQGVYWPCTTQVPHSPDSLIRLMCRIY